MKIAFFKLEEKLREYVKSSDLLKDHELIFFDHLLNDKNIPENRDFEIAVVFVDSLVSKEVIDALPNLKMIAAESTGFDHIDIKYCKEKNIVVSNVPTYGENTVAEFAFALLLSLSRKIVDGYSRIREDNNFNQEGLRGFDLEGKNIGVIGTGHIGEHAIRIAKGFGMNVFAYDICPNEKLSKELDFKYVELDELLSQSDVITFHVPYTKNTHHLINKDNIGKIKKGACIINTSRGGVIDTDALLKALEKGDIAGAGLDVLEEEGITKDELHYLTSNNPEDKRLKTALQNHALIDMPNVIVTPHNAFNTKEALQRILDTTLENIKGFIDGKSQNIVNE